MRLLIMGPQGVGKGTQAALLAGIMGFLLFLLAIFSVTT